jgi:RimJ/RimL family protein N-acetyltransferase
VTALSGHEPQIKISIPAAASRLLGALRRAGFEAYVVGGCVRDSLLGRTPGDWDICTSARPEQVRTVFSAYRQILTGEKHGTVAVIVGGTPYEITTYRVDGQYHDSRHPDAVQFVPQVQPDLARRDFTINAMAYAPGEGLIDLYDFDPYHQRAGLGIMIHNMENRKQGYASSAIKLMLDYCFETLGLNQVYSSVPSCNVASLKLFEATGFTQTGYRKQWLKRGNEWEDVIYFQQLASTWNNN